MGNKDEVNDLDMLDIIRLIERRKGKFLALLITEIQEDFRENGYNTNTRSPNVDPFYMGVRKAVLDSFNDFTRSIDRVLVGGDAEF